jgi:hypothetical protein
MMVTHPLFPITVVIFHSIKLNKKKMVTLILLGSVIGFLVFALLSRGVKQCPAIPFIVQFRINSRNQCFHVHHWLIFLGVLVALVLLARHDTQWFSFSLGFCLGAILQGFTYSDAFTFISPCMDC